MLKKKYNQQYNCLQITDAEKDSVKSYQGIYYSSINSMLELGLGNEIQVQKKISFLGYDLRHIKNILGAYSAMFKNAVQNNNIGLSTLYRGTTVQDVKQIEETKQINKFLSTTTDQSMAEGYFSLNWDNPASIFINANGFIPYVPVSRIDDDYGDNWEKEVLISPFTRVKNISEYGRFGKLTKYSMTIEKQDLPEMSETDRTELFNQISSEVDRINDTLNSFFELNNEMENIHFRIETVQRRSSQGGLSLEERKDNSEYLDELWKNWDKLFAQKRECEEKVNSWKSKVITYCMAECREVEKNIENEMQKEETTIEQDIAAKELDVAKNSLIAKKTYAQSISNNTYEIVGNMDREMGEILENQLRYSEKANELGIIYNKWCDITEAENELNALKIQLSRVKNLTDATDIDITSIDESYKLKQTNVGKITDFNVSINGILIDIDKEELRRINEIELNLFKKAISDRITEIKIDTDSKKIEQEESKINNKSRIRKFFGKFIGQDKVDNLKREQIRAKKSAMGEKLRGNKVTDLNRTYSIHEMLAEIDLYVELNGKDIEMEDGVNKLLNLRKGITSTFRVDENVIKDKVQFYRDNSLPMVQNNKLTRQQRIELETQNWIRQNGYDRINTFDVRTDISQARYNLSSRIHTLSNYIEVNLPNETGAEMKKDETLKEVDLEDTLDLFL